MSYQCKIYDETFDSHRYLYHYTTLDSLVKIIKSRTLLFNRCDKLNDIIEGTRSHVKYYVSCFTYEEEETIPMWYIYTRSRNCHSKDTVGVRLRVENENFFTGILYFDPENKGDHCEVSEFSGIYCGKIIYDDANIGRSPTTGNMDSNKPEGEGLSLKVALTNVPMLGLKGKGTAWAYEKEVRFFTLDNFNNPELNVDKFFLGLEDSFLSKLKVTLSPLLSDDLMAYSKDVIDGLLGKGHCVKSKLFGAIRTD